MHEKIVTHTVGARFNDASAASTRKFFLKNAFICQKMRRQFKCTSAATSKGKAKELRGGEWKWEVYWKENVHELLISVDDTSYFFTPFSFLSYRPPTNIFASHTFFRGVSPSFVRNWIRYEIKKVEKTFTEPVWNWYEPVQKLSQKNLVGSMRTLLYSTILITWRTDGLQHKISFKSFKNIIIRKRAKCTHM